ncbi:MAG: tetratricopeptide repeat protein [Geminicoccaceae bacterium]
MSVPRGILGRLCLFILLVISVPAYGDQRDPRLPKLFDRLSAASNSSEGLLFAHLIDEVWLETKNSQIREPLRHALNAMEEEDLALASKLLDQVVKDAPGFAEGWNKRATVHFLMGDFEASVADIQQTLALEPRHFGALIKLGLICVQLNEPAAALRSFETALELHPHRRYLKGRVDRLRDQLAAHRI